MRYQSTRGDSPSQSFQGILLGGLAPDGGLYLPTQYPQITTQQLDAWRGLSYADLAYEILSLYCDDIPADDLKVLLHKTKRCAPSRVNPSIKTRSVLPNIAWLTTSA